MDPRSLADLVVHQQSYLAAGSGVMDAILEVTARTPATGSGEAPEVAQVMLVDCSGSMLVPPTKITAARRATAAAIDVLRDGAYFAIVAGTEKAVLKYPSAPPMARA